MAGCLGKGCQVRRPVRACGLTRRLLPAPQCTGCARVRGRSAAWPRFRWSAASWRCTGGSACCCRPACRPSCRQSCGTAPTVTHMSGAWEGAGGAAEALWGLDAIAVQAKAPARRAASCITSAPLRRALPQAHR